MAKIAMIAADDFEDSELQVPLEALRAAGHEVVIAGTEQGAALTGKRGDVEVTAEASIASLDADDFDVLVIPGGYSPDKLRLDTDAVRFTHEMDAADKTVAAICHAGSLLIDAAAVKGRTVTSWPSIRVDLKHAGADWQDQPVVIDGNLITSRKPDDLEQFVAAIEERLPAPVGG
jgi:protease I